MENSVEINPYMSLFNFPRFDILFRGFDSFQRVIQEVGAHGIQLAQVHNFRDHELGFKLVDSGLVGSFHQSFANSGPAQLVMPTVAASLGMLKPLEESAKRKYGDWLPVVVHPKEQYLGDQPVSAPVDYVALRRSNEHGPFLHQPTVDVLERWGILDRDDPIQTAHKMLAEQDERGFSPIAVALDLHHIQMPRGEFKALRLDWIKAFAGELAMLGALDYPGEAQMSIRPDFGGDWRHLAQAVNGELAETPHGQILQEILRKLRGRQASLRVTIEVPPAWFNKKGLNLRFIQGNKRLIKAILALAA